MSFEIKKAVRKNSAPFIVLYGESGTGKTYSALLLARGIAGQKGVIRVIDTESGRASLYADIPEFGEYDTVDLSEPFSPARYIEALTTASNGADVVILDSGSHEWEGPGGVCDMAMESELRSNQKGLHNWKVPKFEHSKFVQSLLRSSIPIIICLRAKFKTRQIREGGKTQIIKDDHTSPIQADDFIFEATAHGEIMPDHSLHLTKCSHPSLKECFPAKKPIELLHGQKIAAWCRGGLLVESPELKAAKKNVWDLLKKKLGVNTLSDAEIWLRSKSIFSSEQALSSLSTVEQCEELFNKVTKIL